MEKWTLEILAPLVSESKTYSDVLRKLKLTTFCGNYRTLKKYIFKYSLSTAHFEYPQHSVSACKKSLERVLVFNSNAQSSSLKKRMLRAGIIENKCSLCGQGSVWNGLHISMILDHKNGDSRDCRRENLRMVCPNCNSQLPTHCGRNTQRRSKNVCKICGASRKNRKHKTGLCATCYKTYLKSKRISAPIVKKDRRTSRCATCGKPIVKNKSGKCKACVDRSFVHNKPSKEELSKLIYTTPMTRIGSLYGVTASAVKKWCRKYNLTLKPMRGYWTKVQFGKIPKPDSLSDNNGRPMPESGTHASGFGVVT